MATHKFYLPNTPKQGMSIENIEIEFGDKNAKLKISVCEEGFLETWVFIALVNKKQILWCSAHFWVKNFFNAEVEKYVIQKVGEYVVSFIHDDEIYGLFFKCLSFENAFCCCKKYALSKIFD